MQGRALASHAVRLIGKRVDTARVDPPVIEVEQRTYRDSEIDGVVFPTNGVERLHVFGSDSWRVMIDLADKPEQGFVLLVELGIFQVLQDAPNEFFVSQ